MIGELAKIIRDEVYSNIYNYKTTVFLCGAGKDKKINKRKEVEKILKSEWFSYQYDLFTPEDLFDELLFGQDHYDLINLENILADSVDAVVIILESFGAVAELGAFANNDKLRKKIVCVVNKRYKKDKSFVNYGPIRLLKDKKEGEVVYCNYAEIYKYILSIRRAILKVKKATEKKPNVTNVVQAHHFVLPCIYLFDTASNGLLNDLMISASGVDERVAKTLTASALSILSKNREIIKTTNGFRLTENGKRHFINLGQKGRTGRNYNIKTMDKIRVEILNWKYRNKVIKL